MTSTRDGPTVVSLDIPGIRGIPGPRYVPTLGWRWQALKMLRDPAKHLAAIYRRYGPISAWETRTPRYVCAFGPEFNEALFTNPDRFVVDPFRENQLPRGSAMDRLSFGLLRLNGDEHRRHRKLMQAAFSARKARTLRDVIVAAARIELDGWRLNELRRIDEDLERLIFKIAMTTMFGLDTAESGEQLQVLIRRLLASAGAPATLLFRLNLPGTSYGEMLRAAGGVERILSTLIRARRANQQPEQDALSLLIAARDDHGRGFTDEELIGEAYTVLCHSGSVAALTWTLFLLDQQPRVLGDLVNELQAILRGEAPTVEDLQRCPLLDAVVKESLRIFPPASFGLRYTSEACTFGSYELPKDTAIFFSAYVSHRISDIFPQPLRFDPRRWERAAPSPYAYIPFGVGPHVCLGLHISLLEIKIILAMLLQRFRPTLAANARIDRGMRISMVPKHGLPMVLRPVGAAGGAGLVRGNIRESVDLGA